MRLAEQEFLQAEEKREAKDFCAALGGGAGDLRAVNSLPAQFCGDEGEGDSQKKKEQRRGKGAKQLRPAQ